MLWYLLWFYSLSAVIFTILCCLSWDMIESLDDLDHKWMSRKTIADDINSSTPFVIIPHWIVNILCYFCGETVLVLLFLPLSLLYIFQYRQRMADSGYGYHNPIKFYSEKHVRGLKQLFYITSGFYALCTATSLVFIVFSLINAI